MQPRSASSGVPDCRARASVLAAAMALLAGPRAAADVSLVQVTESRFRRGERAVYAKTLVEVSGRKMRLVSGYAPKAGGSGGGEAPLRLIRIIDLDGMTAVRVEPETRTYEEYPLDEIMPGERAGPGRAVAMAVASSVVSAEPGPEKMTFQGVVCGRWKLTARMRLKGPGGRAGRARLTQDVWLAPASGGLIGLLDLMAFDRGFRSLTGAALSPLEYETYQVREAASALGVSEFDLIGVIGAMKARLKDVPGYPLSSSVTWWRSGDGAGAAGPGRPARRPAGREGPAGMEDRDRPDLGSADGGRSRLGPEAGQDRPEGLHVQVLGAEAGSVLMIMRGWARGRRVLALWQGPLGGRPSGFRLGRGLRDREEGAPGTFFRPASRHERSRRGDGGSRETAAGAAGRGPRAGGEPRRDKKDPPPAPLHEALTKVVAFLDVQGGLPKEHFEPPPGYARR